MKKLLLLFIFIFNGILFSQENPNIKIGLKDNHYSNITCVLLSNDEKKIISADETGKILMFNTSDYSYEKTIRESSGIAIEGMRLAKNDSILMFSQKYKYSDGTNDSLIMVSTYDNKILLKQKRSASFLGNSNSNVIISKTNKNYNSTIEFFKKDFEKILKFETDKTVTIAEISKNCKTIIYTEGDIVSQENIVIKDVATATIIKQIPIPEGTIIVHLFFDENTENFYVIALIESEKELSIFKGSESVNWKKPIFTFPSRSYFSDTVISDTELNNEHTIIFTSSLASFDKPLVLKNKADNFSATTLFSNEEDFDKNASHSLVLNSKNQLLLFQAFNPNFFDIAGFYTYDLKNKKTIGKYPKNTNGFYSGAFLPNDNWMAMENPNTYGGNVKFYSSGTFSNRYDKLSLKNYLQINHNIETVINIFFDKKKGSQIFLGKEKTNDSKYYYYRYDLINDKVEKLYDENKSFFVMTDYNDKEKMLLLFEKKYPGEGYNEKASSIMILSENNNIEFTDTYKTAKFSDNGNYLLTINKDDLAEVRTLPNKEIIFSKKLLNGNYDIISVDVASFIINNNLWRNKTAQNCYTQNIIITIENDTVKDQVRDCVLISDVSYVNENIAMILNNNFVVVNDKPVVFKGLESPLQISFNSDASKFMISFKNGSTVVYETKTVKELGRMIHPNENSHIFLDSQGNYFSNIDADQYLWATKNSLPVSLKSIDKEVFKPEKLLALFGKSNEEYAKILQQAVAIRNESKSKGTENSTNQSTTTSVEEVGKPNLYLVSIGVSDYQQSKYNLTFADKDALDIIKIYGSLNDKEFRDYNDKFFGNVFSIYGKNGEVGNEMKKFLGTYKSVGNFYNTNSENLWVESKNDKLNLWNFNNKTVDSIAVPKDFPILLLYDDNNIIASPDGTGFSLIGLDDNVFSYNFLTKKSKVYKLPFNVHKNNYTLTGEDKWLIFDYEHIDSTSTIAISFYEEKSKKTIQKIKFNPHQYQNRDVNGNFTNINVENYNSYIIPELRAVSPNGKYLLYSTNSESIFFVDITQNNPKPIKINFNSILKYSSKISLSSEANKFCVLNSDGDKYTAITIDMFGKIIDSQTIENQNYAIKGISISDAEPKWIKMSNQLLEDNYFETEDNKLINSNTPFSFDKVYTANFTNQNADSKSIKNSLSNFFKNTKSNDQVMIFMAGHGMLDSKNNYYFAPYDMDFEKPETNGIAFDFIVNSLKNTPAKNKLLLLDSCHSGTTLDISGPNSNSKVVIPSNNKRGSGATAVNQKPTYKVSEVISSLFDNFLSTSGVTILSASSGSDVAYEYKNVGNGAFTASFTELLKEKLKSGITLEAEDFTRPIVLNKDFITEFFKRVMITTENKQVPDIREINDKSEIKIW